MAVALLCVAVAPVSEVSSAFGLVNSIRGLDFSKLAPKDRILMLKGRGYHKWRASKLSTDLREAGLRSGSRCPTIPSMLATPVREIVASSEERVYNVVLKQAALVKEQQRSRADLDVKPDIALPRSISVLNEAYDQCGEVCAEYAKTFYLD